MSVCHTAKSRIRPAQRSATACADITKERIVIDAGDNYCGTGVRLKTMDVMVVGATFVGSIATAFFVQRAVLGAMLRAFGRDKAARR